MGLTDKDILDAMKKMGGAESPDSFLLNQQFSDALAIVITMAETQGGVIDVSYGDTRYKIKVTRPRKTAKPEEGEKIL